MCMDILSTCNLCTMYLSGVLGGQKRVLELKGLELKKAEKAVSYHVGDGTKPGSPGRATSDLNF